MSNEDASFGKGSLYKIFGGGDSTPIYHVRIFAYKALIDFLSFHNFEIIKSGGGGYRLFENYLWNFFPNLAPFNWVICRKK